MSIRKTGRRATHRSLRSVLGDVEENDIILLHDASESSVLAAFKIIDELKAQGYTFVTVEDILLD